MKLKEAQMLGILALIAVGIILLCMWGGEDAPQSDAMAQDGTGATEVEETDQDLEKLYEDLLYGGGTETAEAESEEPPTYAIEMGGQEPPATSPPSEEAVIRDVIEENQPDEIPLNPVNAGEEEPEPEQETVRPRRRSVTHIVQKGETLSSISKEYYGTTGKWREILAANKSVVSAPSRLMPDMRLTIPDVSSAGATAQRSSAARPTLATNGNKGRTHTVVKGDNLYRIARRYYGRGEKWRQIRSANKDLISSPQDLKPGMVLSIP
jgi:nucleoid-associated protein YgaU